MGLKTRTVMKPVEEEYFVTEIEDICEQILNYRKIKCGQYPNICIVSIRGYYELKQQFISQMFYAPNGDLQVMGVKIISSPELEEDSIKVY